MPAPESRSRSSSPYVVEQAAVSLRRSVPGTCWNWRTEIAIAVAVVGWFFSGWWLLGWWLWPLLVLLALVLVLGAVPWSRRFLLARFWALFTRHRLQRAFWELRLHTRAGRLPLVPWISGTPVGSRAWVLLRAGMTFEDFEESAAAFAAACGARDCQVTASPRWSSLIWIDIIRRDALGPARVITSPLADLSTDGPAWPVAWAAEDLP